METVPTASYYHKSAAENPPVVWHAASGRPLLGGTSGSGKESRGQIRRAGHRTSTVQRGKQSANWPQIRRVFRPLARRASEGGVRQTLSRARRSLACASG